MIATTHACIRSGSSTTLISSLSCVPPPSSQMLHTVDALFVPVERRAKRYSSAVVGFCGSSFSRKLWISVDLPAPLAPTKSSSESPAPEPTSASFSFCFSTIWEMTSDMTLAQLLALRSALFAVSVGSPTAAALHSCLQSRRSR